MSTKVRTVKATIILETTFESYGSEALDERAQEQIESWIRETLEEDDNIPLFITNLSGDVTGEKYIVVKTQME